MIWVALGLGTVVAVLLVAAAERHYRRFDRRYRVAERRHARYDAEVGWVGIPNLRLRDFYGPGRSLHADRWGFRGLEDADPARRRRPIRVLCSGDSMTLGYGVDDAAAWPALLEAADRRIEMINMGMGGFGIQQSYLWYRRDGERFHPDLHIFAIIPNDFVRMGVPDFFGYPRPIVVREGGALRTTPPGPPRGRGSALLRALEGRAQRVAWGAPRASPSAVLFSDEVLVETAVAIFADLAAGHRARGAAFMVVFLPLLSDRIKGESAPWRAALRAPLARAGIPFLDLVEEFLRLPAPVAEGLFIRPGEVDFCYAEGHYNEAGNRWVAERLAAEMRGLAEIAAVLNRGDR